MTTFITTPMIEDLTIATADIANLAVTTAKIADANVTTVKIADANVTPAKLSQPLTQGTAVASTSGTSIDFTGIPSWAKRITVMFVNVSTNGSATPMIQVGSGSVTTSGYAGAASGGASTLGTTTYSAGMLVYGQAWANNTIFSGHAVLTNVSGNLWTASIVIGAHTNPAFGVGGGNITLSGVLDRVRITTTNGTDTFDLGSINILYE